MMGAVPMSRGDTDAGPPAFPRTLLRRVVNSFKAPPLSLAYSLSPVNIPALTTYPPEVVVLITSPPRSSTPNVGADSYNVAVATEETSECRCRGGIHDGVGLLNEDAPSSFDLPMKGHHEPPRAGVAGGGKPAEVDPPQGFPGDGAVGDTPSTKDALESPQKLPLTGGVPRLRGASGDAPPEAAGVFPPRGVTMPVLGARGRSEWRRAGGGCSRVGAPI